MPGDPVQFSRFDLSCPRGSLQSGPSCIVKSSAETYSPSRGKLGKLIQEGCITPGIVHMPSERGRRLLGPLQPQHENELARRNRKPVGILLLAGVFVLQIMVD